MVDHGPFIVKPSGCTNLRFPSERYPENSIHALWITCGVMRMFVANIVVRKGRVVADDRADGSAV